MGETNFLAENAREALTDLREFLQSEFRRYTHQPQAVLPEEPKLLADPRVVDLRWSVFVEDELWKEPCIVLQQCTRRCEFGSGSSEDDFALEHIVVVAYSVYYRRARADFENLPSLHEMWTPVVSEILFTDVNGNVLSYEGCEIDAAEDVVTLEEERWFYGAKNSSVEDMRLELIRYRGNNCFIAGWNLGLLFTALGLAIPE